MKVWTCRLDGGDHRGPRLRMQSPRRQKCGKLSYAGAGISILSSGVHNEGKPLGDSKP